MGLKLRKTQTGSWENPSEGLHKATLAKVEDVGPRDFGRGSKNYIRLIYEVQDQRTRAGEPMTVGALLNASLNERSTMYQHVRALLGSVPDEVNLDNLIGLDCQIILAHRQDGQGKTWANITTVLPPAKKEEATAAPDPKPKVGYPLFDLPAPEDPASQAPAPQDPPISEHVARLKRYFASCPQRPEEAEDVSFPA